MDRIAMKNEKKGLSKIICFLFLFTCIWVTFNVNNWKSWRVIRSDSAGYYLYLPATFIYHDLFYLRFYQNIDSTYHPTDNLKGYAIYKSRITKKFFTKYSCGVALFEMPLFLVAHLYCIVSGSYPLDGYSVPFQLSVAFSNILFSFLGLIILRAFLLNYYDDKAVSICLLIIAFGTNLFVYTGMTQGMSHVYLFFIYSCVLYLTYKWYESFRFSDSAILGFVIGLAIITRPTDILICIFPILWGVTSFSKLKDNFKVWKKNYSKIITGFIFFSFPLALQMIYWKETTGSWVYYSYEGEGFDFSHPHIFDGLFSYRKGWFVYTPLALLGFIGTYFLSKDKSYKFYLLPFSLFFISTIYVLFSWKMWFYGGSFGCRVLIQSLALLAFPMAFFIQKILQKKSSFITWGLIFFFGISLNLFQSWQYNADIIHWDNMNKKSYWFVFGKTSLTNAERESLYGSGNK